MKRLKSGRLFGIVFLVLAAGCASSGGTASSEYKDSSTIDVDNSALPLSYYLRRVPGVYVAGSGRNISILIQGVHSFRGTSQPLFVVDGVRVGRDYSRVSSLVNVADIDYIKVLKGPDASIYGVEGGNGVIEIRTKGS